MIADLPVLGDENTPDFRLAYCWADAWFFTQLSPSLYTITSDGFCIVHGEWETVQLPPKVLEAEKDPHTAEYSDSQDEEAKRENVDRAKDTDWMIQFEMGNRKRTDSLSINKLLEQPAVENRKPECSRKVVRVITLSHRSAKRSLGVKRMFDAAQAAHVVETDAALDDLQEMIRVTQSQSANDSTQVVVGDIPRRKC